MPVPSFAVFALPSSTSTDTSPNWMGSKWARAQRAEESHSNSTSGIEPEPMDKLLHRLGFQTHRGNYAVTVSRSS
jgi:hypothetical protein